MRIQIPLSIKISLSFILFFSSPVQGEDTVFVQVRTSKLRSAPNPWSPAKATMSYGDALKTISTEGAWWNVKTAKGQSGYIASSSVTNRQIVLSSNARVSSGFTDTADVVMAGKGFSKEVENSFAMKGSLNYSAVNKIESVKVLDNELQKFIKDGQLSGGAQ